MEAEHYVFARHPCFEQRVGDRTIGSVVLNPDFVVNDVEMDYRAENAPYTLPTDVLDFVMISFRINHDFDFDLPVAGFVFPILVD